jgi:hypothetical protein
MTEMREGKWDWRGMWNARREIKKKDLLEDSEGKRQIWRAERGREAEKLKKNICSKILKGKDKFGELGVDGKQRN